MENGFLLNDGAKKKKSALFLPVKQYPDVVLSVEGVSDLDRGRRIIPTSLCERFLSSCLSGPVCY